jgi:hypothetical protein
MSYDYDGGLHVDLAKAIGHHEAAGAAIDAMPDLDDNPEEHARCVRSFHAHIKAADEYLESYRDAKGIDDDHDVETGNPETGSAPEERRARLRRLRGGRATVVPWRDRARAPSI